MLCQRPPLELSNLRDIAADDEHHIDGDAASDEHRLMDDAMPLDVSNRAIRIIRITDRAIPNLRKVGCP